MANAGKFIDRNPDIPAAGVASKLPDLLPCLNYHSLEEEVEAILPSRHRKETPPYPARLQPPKPENYGGYYTQVKSLISPPRQSLLVDLLSEIREPSNGLPAGMDPLTTTFGIPTGVEKDVDHVDEVVFPNQPYGETKLAQQLGRELYEKSHSGYLVGQRRDLNYEAPTNVTYGKISFLDQTGILTKKSLKWFNQETVSRTSKGQARVRERTHYEVGKVLTPNNIQEKVGKNKVFGHITQFDDTGAREGMRLCPVDKSMQINGEYLGFLCSVRKAIKKKDPPFPFFDLVTNLKLLDEGGCGCLPLALVYEVCERLGLYFNKEMLEVVLRYLGVIHGENNDIISYHGFCNILDFRKPLPEFPKVDDVPDEFKLYESNYQTQTRDIQKKNELDKEKKAGVPSVRTDRISPGEGKCKGEKFLLLDETNVDSCIRPSIFSYYGLTPRDFLQPKTKEYMKDLWKRIGLNIPDNIFDEMWKEGLTREENDGKTVCIETFKNMLDEMCEAKLVEVRES